MKYRTSINYWQKGRDYISAEAVKVKEDRTDHKGRHLAGKVKCNFGFVHHPSAVLTEQGGQMTVAASGCDCGESNEGNIICSHCAALVLSVLGQGTPLIRKDPALSTAIPAEVDFRLSALKIETFPRSREEYTAKAHCNFGFVHYPHLVAVDGRIVEANCDCYLFDPDTGKCPHCAELYRQVMAGKEWADVPPAEDRPAGDADHWAVFPEEISFDEAVTEELVTAQEPACQERPAPEQEAVPAKAVLAPAVQPQRKPAEEVTEEETAAEEPEKPAEQAARPEPEPAPAAGPVSMKILFGTDVGREAYAPAGEDGGDGEEAAIPGDGNQVYWYPNDTHRLFHINTGIIGTMGTGKTQFTKSLITQLYQQQRRGQNFMGNPLGILIFDYKGDYNESKQDFVQAVNAKVLKPYQLPFNPFELKGLKSKPQLHLQTAGVFTDIIKKVYNLGPKQEATLLHAITDSYRKCGISANPASWTLPAPTFDMVFKTYMEDESVKKNDSLFAAMDRLAQYEIFEKDRSKTSSLYDMIRGVVVIDLSGYDDSIQNLVVAIILQLFYSQMQNRGSSAFEGHYRQLTKIILVDEADNFMSQGFDSLKKILKEGREFGVGTILSTQFLDHFMDAEDDYSKYILTWVVHNVPDLKRRDVSYIFHTAGDSAATERLENSIKTLEPHHSIVKIGNQPPLAVHDKPFWQLIQEQ